MQLTDLEKPTKRWIESMKDGDDIFTEENIKATDSLLDEFINNLKKLSDTPDDTKIVLIVEKLVKALNALNEKYAHIDTVEREELVGDFILPAIKIVGFSRNDDVTEEWREW